MNSCSKRKGKRSTASNPIAKYYKPETQSIQTNNDRNNPNEASVDDQMRTYSVDSDVNISDEEGTHCKPESAKNTYTIQKCRLQNHYGNISKHYYGEKLILCQCSYWSIAHDCMPSIAYFQSEGYVRLRVASSYILFRHSA